jgi:hypothetical protein
VRGIDVILKGEAHSKVHKGAISAGLNYLSKTCWIEIKPVVGDDYPAVLRQMRTNQSTILFLDQYIGRGATKEQFIKTFASAGITVVFLNQITNMNAPGKVRQTDEPERIETGIAAAWDRIGEDQHG